MKSIIFIGMRWTWKTTLWKQLAKNLNLNFFDTDHIIEELEQMKCSKLVEKHWWDKFRLTEKKALNSLKPNKAQVIATWWWLPFYFDNKQKLKSLWTIIWLKANSKFIKKMISLSSEKNKRASLTWDSITNEVDKVLEKRDPIYEELSDITIDVDKQDWNQVMKSIMKEIKKFTNKKT